MNLTINEIIELIDLERSIEGWGKENNIRFYMEREFVSVPHKSKVKVHERF